ncbi:xanthine dehydrogenase family protein subunit M [Pigmentiphaga soli]|uniref:Xanthine dehydrogenase family protein subunit M n=1 Tax=Pigmentiphaga soli TaxID=1007095 RepID=A0ABP8GTG2_9BURK
MKAAPFEYERAESVEHACELLERHGFDAKLLAGGQSLVPMMAMRLARPAVLVDINRLQELKAIEDRGDAIAMGAGARQQAVKDDDALAARVPLLRHALHWVGHVQTRNRGTVGGSLVHADPSAELPLSAQVLEAEIVLRSARGTRTLTAREFFVGIMQTATEPDECAVEIRWPVWAGGGVGAAFEETSMRHGDFAIVAAAAQLQIDADGRCTRAAFGVAGVDGTPLAFPDIARELVGSRPGPAEFEAVADQLSRRIEPGDDLHASAAYRRHLAKVLTARVLAAARERSGAVRQQ